MRKGLYGFFISWFFVLVAGSVFAEKVEADSKIARVTIYPSSAMITRTATVALAQGASQVVFSGIIPNIDENSLRVSGEAAGDVKILGAEVRRQFEEESTSQKVKELQQQIQALEDEKKRLADAQAVVGADRDFLKSIAVFSEHQLPRDLVTKVPSAKELGDLLGFLDTSYKDNLGREMDLILKSRDLDKKLEVLYKELGQLSQPNRMKRSIIVDVQSAKAGKLDLSVSYLVAGAMWRPVYEARTIFDKAAVELVLFGVVRQTTGEDWPEVEAALSTSRPNLGGRMPDVNPWLLRPYQPPPPQSLREKAALGGMMARKTAVSYESYNMAADELESAQGGDEAESPVVMAYAVAEEKGVSVVYKVPRRATIKSDGSEQRLPIAGQMLAARFKYAAFPKASAYAYLTSRVTSAKDAQLLAGRVNVFLENEFVGISSLDAVSPGEEFSLSLGVDENVPVKRELIEKKADDVLIGGIPSPAMKMTFKYKLTVENYKSQPIDFELFETMPVSQEERIKVRVDKASIEPKQKNWKDKKGVWLWEFSLKPKEKKEIIYTLIIEYPRGMQVEGL